MHFWRFAGVHGDDKANNQKLLKLMEGVENRGCGFASAIGSVNIDSS